MSTQTEDEVEQTPTDETVETRPETGEAWMQSVRAGLDEVLDAVKVGARNSKRDTENIQGIHDHAVSLGASCKPMPKSSKAGETDPATDETPVAKIEVMGLSLDRLVRAVEEAFWSLRSKMRREYNISAGREPDAWDSNWDDSTCPGCEAVFDGYAIGRQGLIFWNIPYTIEPTGVVLSEQTEWTQASQEWVTKHMDLLGLIERDIKRRDLGAVKVIGQGRLGNYLVAWGDEKHRDLYGEFFQKDTQGLKTIFDWLGGKLPALYQHAMDGTIKYTPIGTIDVMEIDEVGLWIETQLDLSNQYAVAVQKLASRKALGSSSGCLPGSRQSLPNGKIATWAIIEGSYTPTPAEPRLRELGVDVIKGIYSEYGLEFPEVPDVLKRIADGEEPGQASNTNALDVERELLELELIELETE